MSYAANLLFRPKLWLKHGMARTLNLAINHPKEAFASMYACVRLVIGL